MPTHPFQRGLLLLRSDRQLQQARNLFERLLDRLVTHGGDRRCHTEHAKLSATCVLPMPPSSTIAARRLTCRPKNIRSRASSSVRRPVKRRFSSKGRFETRTATRHQSDGGSGDTDPITHTSASSPAPLTASPTAALSRTPPPSLPRIAATACACASPCSHRCPGSPSTGSCPSIPTPPSRSKSPFPSLLSDLVSRRLSSPRLLTR